MRKFLAMLTFLALPLAGPAYARAMEPEAARLTAEWRELNSECRGRSGDLPETQAACARRDRLTARLERMGWCYGLPGEPSYKRFWRRCDGSWR